MLDTQARSLKNIVLAPLTPVFSLLSPNQLSVVGVVCAVIMGVLLYQGMFGLGLLFWLLNRLFDGMDGIVAREQGLQTDMGGYIDIVLDYIAYALVPVTLVAGMPTTEHCLALAVLLAVFYANSASWLYLSALLEKRNMGARARNETTSVSIPGGIVGGFLTIVYYCAFIMFPQYLETLFWSMAILTALGVVQRLWWARANLPN